jgi:ankyrin repeat protein
MHAVGAGHGRVVKMLLAAGARSAYRDKFGMSPLELASSRRDGDIVALLR